MLLLFIYRSPKVNRTFTQLLRRYHYIFIDECQDLSKAQLATVMRFGHEKSRVFSVGDPRQSIYGFTGADIESFNSVKKITAAIQLPLASCFRCPQNVIKLAQTIRSDINGVKQEEGEVITITPEQVISYAVPGDLIVSRLRAPLLILVFDFIDKDIRVQIHEDEVTEILSEMKGIFKHEELQGKIAHIQGGFSALKKVVRDRGEWAIRKDAERIVSDIERKLHIDNQNEYLRKKLEFLHRKYEQWKQNCSTVGEVIERIRQFISATENSIRLSTIHRAKGLENDVVFILGYDMLPLQHLEQKGWEKIQELNLKYVAVTRAKQKLYLVQAPKIEILEKKSLFDVMPFDEV